MSPSEVDLAPELTKQILDAVDQGFEQQLTFTQQMMALDSTRGNEHQAQTCFFEALDFRGYEMDQWSIDVAQIESHPGFSPVKVNYDNAVNVVGTHTPEETKGL